MSLAEYIRSRYPGMLQNGSSDQPIGFILNKSTVGVMNGNGDIKNIGDVHEVEILLQQDFDEITKRIPMVEPLEGARSFDTVLLNTERVPKDLQEKIIADLKAQLANDSAERKTVFADGKSVLVVNSNDEDKIKRIHNEYRNFIDKCNRSIVSQKMQVIEGIKAYQERMRKYIQDTTLDKQAVKELSDKMQKEQMEVLARLDEQVRSTTDQNIIQTIDAIKQELQRTTEMFQQSQLKVLALKAHQEQCARTVLQQKDMIIQRIKKYNEMYMKFTGGLKESTQAHKVKLLEELQQVKSLLEAAKQNTGNLSDRESQQLRQNITDITRQLNKTVADNLIQLNLRDQEIQRLKDLNTTESTNHKAQITQLKRELEQVRTLLAENDNTVIKPNTDYTSCYDTVKAFCALNNVFYRKQEVIKRIEQLLAESNLSASIRDQFATTKARINRHIDFLDLKKYVNDQRCRQNLEFFKSEITSNRVPKSFCDELFALVNYWDQNKVEYREQDRILTNIYEDLSGAVRVYIRIKPLLGLEQANRTITIANEGGIKQKRVKLICGDREGTFGEFYGVFDQSFSNRDVYTGIENSESVIPGGVTQVNTEDIIEASDTVSPGLWSTIRQVEDGYSVVIFGYGASGSGKTMTLLGSGKIPGLIHYARSNLRDVSSFKLKYMFEQYYSLVNFNFKKVTGKIHMLVGKIPQLSQFTYDETVGFAQQLSGVVDTGNVKESDLFTLTSITDNYRQSLLRVAKTPNNPQSSRSHLFMVFEVTFGSGKKGYITFVDTAGRESPQDIFNTFIDTQQYKTSLESIMAPSGGETMIEKYMKSDVRNSYTAKEIHNILKQSFYINETINHMVYYFNTKNNIDPAVVMQSETGDYQNSKFFVNPRTESNKINNSNNALTIPILKFLDNLSNKNKTDLDYKPTKFVTIVALRQEVKYCDQTFESMQFASSIKST